MLPKQIVTSDCHLLVLQSFSNKNLGVIFRLEVILRSKIQRYSRQLVNNYIFGSIFINWKIFTPSASKISQPNNKLAIFLGKNIMTLPNLKILYKYANRFIISPFMKILRTRRLLLLGNPISK